MKSIFLFFLIGCTPATFPAVKPITPVVIGPVTADGCEEACTNREKLGCLDPELKDQCIPTCHKTVAYGLFDAKCAAFATRDQMYPLCNVRCY